LDFKKIIFDLDGTLVNTYPDVSACINRALVKMGRRPLTEAEARLAIGPGKEAFLKAVLGDQAASEEQHFLKIFREFYHIHCLDTTTVFPGIEALLQKLQGVTLLVATNKPGPAARRILKGLNIIDYFERVIGPEDVVHAKPHPEMIEFAVQHSPTPKEATLFIGDTDLDIKAGNAAGVMTCAALYGYGNQAAVLNENPDYFVHSPLEINELKVNQCV